MNGYISYLMVFCRVFTGFVFLLSAYGKTSDISSFQKTINSFRLINSKLAYPLSFIFISIEWLIVIFIVSGGEFLLYGYMLAIVLLIVFTTALTIVLFRQISTTCNCFGSSSKPVTKYDVVRNCGLLSCSTVGLYITFGNPNITSLTLENAIIVGVFALILVLLWLHFDEIISIVLQV